MLSSSAVMAYDEKWQDDDWGETMNEAGDGLIPNSRFRVDGVIFAGYEFQDHETNGAPDSTGPDSQKSGFTIGRAYVNIRGDVKEGDWAGWGFRITSDIGPHAEQGDGCDNGASSACSQDNDYNVFLKYAYVTIPLPMDGMALRLGQQHVPFVDGQAGVSLQSECNHRYIAKVTTEDVSMSSSTDRGLAFIYEQDYFGIHALLGNGEGYHHNNAENLTNAPTLSQLSKGNVDSYGHDLYALFSATPTGTAKDFSFKISVPLRLYNIYGIDSQAESRYVALDIYDDTNSTLSGFPSYQIRQGDVKAKRDMSYGLEGDFSMEMGELELGVGAGTLYYVDRRSNAYQISDEIIRNGLAAKDFYNSSNFVWDEDAYGWSNYGFAHARYGFVGVLFRYTEGSGSAGKLTTGISGKSWLQQMWEYDLGGTSSLDKLASGTQLGNTTLLEAYNNIDLGKARFRKYLYGVTFYISPAFRVTVGTDYQITTNGRGQKTRVSPLSRIPNDSSSSLSASGDLETQIESGLSAFNSNLSGFDLAQLGSEQKSQQIWIRSEYSY
ncbi:MAG: hypothetical protein KDK27_04725 [Leptospiraceae bacterium]|nr:hypothetical protein [Leptospiraceae bacterium]